MKKLALIGLLVASSVRAGTFTNTLSGFDSSGTALTGNFTLNHTKEITNTLGLEYVYNVMDYFGIGGAVMFAIDKAWGSSPVFSAQVRPVLRIIDNVSEHPFVRPYFDLSGGYDTIGIGSHFHHGYVINPMVGGMFPIVEHFNFIAGIGYEMTHIMGATEHNLVWRIGFAGTW